MSERQSAAHATVGAAAAAPRPGGQGERSDEHASVPNPDIEHRKPRGSSAPIQDVKRFMLVFGEHADHEIHAARHVGIDQPRGGGPEHSS